MKKDNVIVDKSKALALRIINVYKYLCEEMHEYILSKQLIRSGTSIGANIKLLPFDTRYFTSNFTPLFEEVFKALPILVYAFMFKQKKRTLLECSVLVGVGFAVLVLLNKMEEKNK